MGAAKCPIKRTVSNNRISWTDGEVKPGNGKSPGIARALVLPHGLAGPSFITDRGRPCERKHSTRNVRSPTKGGEPIAPCIPAPPGQSAIRQAGPPEPPKGEGPRRDRSEDHPDSPERAPRGPARIPVDN